MANKAISELPQAQNVNNQDLFVLEQSGIAKKLPAETFITEQGIIDALAEALDGHGGIQSVTLSSVSGRIRTYLITFTDGTSTTFQVLDGTSIDRVTKTSTAGLVDTYTIFMNDGTTTFFTVTNGADGTVSEAMLNDALKDKAPAITETTESSAIANFTDGADDLVMHNIVAEINPVQSGSGDPSPSNIRPISGWTGCNVTRTGKNLCEPTEATYKDESGSWFNGTDIASVKNALNALPVGEYTISFKFDVLTTVSGATSWGILIHNTASGYIDGRKNGQHNADETLSFSKTFSVTESNKGKFDHVYMYSGGGNHADVYWYDFQLELGSSATAYEPYITPSTVSLSWQTEAGTVYGGTIDVATGVLTVTMKALENPESLGWAWQSAYNVFNYRPIADNAFKDTGKVVSSAYAYGGAYSNLSNFECGYIYTNHIAIRDDSFSGNVDAFKASLSSIQIFYELATPQTYQLTPQEVKTLLGTNNVWADTGNVSVTYPADTKMFIEKLTMPTEDDLVANQAITSGKYFMIGNSLYLALANIASGAQITIGTNAQRVSLADALNTINS